jgi:hypothetical protein
MKVEIRESQRSVLALDLCKPPIEFKVIQVQQSGGANNPKHEQNSVVHNSSHDVAAMYSCKSEKSSQVLRHSTIKRTLFLAYDL